MLTLKRVWNNEDGIYTLDYAKHGEKLPVMKYIEYRLQKILHFTTY